MQHRYPDDQIPHLANGVFQALRNGWRIQSTDLHPSSGLGARAGRIPHAESKIIINSQAAMRVLPPHEHTGPAGHTAILIDAHMHDDFLLETPPAHADEWTDAITTPSSIYTLWRWRTDRQQWRPHPALPSSVPETGIKLTRWLLTAGMIWAVTPEQMNAFQGHAETPESPESIILAALG